MRIAAILMLLLTLSGCVGGGSPFAGLNATAVQDDAHCQSLLMHPGSLVYAQCRLALRRTYLDDYATRKVALEKQYGPVSDRVNTALRNDAFCNYDESVKAAMDAGDEVAAAHRAYTACDSTRQQLADALAAEHGEDGNYFVGSEQHAVIDENIATVEAARAVVNGPDA